jgi:hypothetical protein
MPIKSRVPSIETFTGNLKDDRIKLFGSEFENVWILDRLQYLMTREGGKNADLILETVCNRAMFSGTSLGNIIRNADYFTDSSNTKPHTKFTLDIIQKVVYNGSNRTNLGTDNGYNVWFTPKSSSTRELFMRHFIKHGVTGSWFDLKTGEIITDSGRVEQLTNSPGNGMIEFIYRKDGHGDGYMPYGIAARQYAERFNIKPTEASTFVANQPLPESLKNVVKSELTGEPARTVSEDNNPSTVLNTSQHGPTIVKNTNDMPKGMFTFPAAGAMVWCFFREGNPLYPVYFAASYSTDEWKGAYSGSSLNPDGTNQGTVGNRVSNTTKFNPNAGGGFEFTHIKDNSDPSGASDKTVALMYSDDGSNLGFFKGHAQEYIRHDKKTQIDGRHGKIVGGSEEEWIEEDYSSNVRGNAVIKIGKIDAETVEAIKQLSSFSKQVNKKLLRNPQ